MGNQGAFYRTLDAWLTEIAKTRPETAQHIERQSVLLALTIDATHPNSTPEQRANLFVQSAFAGMLHDVGKLAIAPQLLDKASRISRHEMNRVLHAYQAAIPEYPEKKDDMKFLEMANGGRVFFAKNIPASVTRSA
jgi:response regulator RpfG family c-di-GMP phosphodiesterase